MPALYRAKLAEFVECSTSEVTGLLSIAYAREGFTAQKAAQTLAWSMDLEHLRGALAVLLAQTPAAAGWTVLLEFIIPRKMRRIDVVLLAGDTIVLLEQKGHAPTQEDCLQAEEYALLLHYFHQPSHRRRIGPLVISPVDTPLTGRAVQYELAYLQTPAYWIAPVRRLQWSALPRFLASLETGRDEAIDAATWEQGSYRPVPTIIEAALALQTGLAIREIAHSSAARQEVDALTALVQGRVREARAGRRHIILFVTGVPGSGKTLVGLNLAFSKQASDETIHFMSGNGPLVKVLQVVLARHRMRDGVRALDAKIHARTLIENVHVFAKTYTDDDKLGAPSNHVVIFDEAQRAWDRGQNMAKFKRPYSEPEMLLSIMERHEDWGVVIALVGGGQEINNGEAGLSEWGRSLSATTGRSWTVYASPEALRGGTSVAGDRLSIDGGTVKCHSDPRLHLDVSVRSLGAEFYARWVNAVVTGDADQAAELRLSVEFPIFLSRDISETRRHLLSNTLGLSRAGLVASSQAARLRAEGLEPDSAFHGGYPWEHWYLAGREDVRSSFQLEVFATEFEIQGLELDWIGLCWGGDFVWSPVARAWKIRAFRAGISRWSEVKSSSRRIYRENAYRVLMTRARQGIVIYVPRGDPADSTRDPTEMDATAEFLESCGARLITDLGVGSATAASALDVDLFSKH